MRDRLSRYDRALGLPVWRRNLHSTQGWPVMGAADDQEDGHTDVGYKSVATQAKLARSGGKEGSVQGFTTSENEEVLMLSATVSKRLEALPDISKQGKRINGLFRLFESPELWQEAYAKIHANKGAITRGVD